MSSIRSSIKNKVTKVQPRAVALDSMYVYIATDKLGYLEPLEEYIAGFDFTPVEHFYLKYVACIDYRGRAYRL